MTRWSKQSYLGVQKWLIYWILCPSPESIKTKASIIDANRYCLLAKKPNHKKQLKSRYHVCSNVSFFKHKTVKTVKLELKNNNNNKQIWNEVIDQFLLTNMAGTLLFQPSPQFINATKVKWKQVKLRNLTRNFEIFFSCLCSYEGFLNACMNSFKHINHCLGILNTVWWG